MDQVIAFGIPSLDEMLAEQPGIAPGYRLRVAQGKQTESTSICIIGPDGTGKSLLALHLASQYRATALPGVRVLYVSTDLSSERASNIWKNFLLGRPIERLDKLPFNGTPHPQPIAETIELKSYKPLVSAERDEDDFMSYLCHRHPMEVAFVDLESTTAGDDWGLVNRIMAVLPPPMDLEPRHLLVIDAVEGLQNLVGDRDAFGQRRTRRSRIAQVVRTASEKCHVVFIVEERKDGIRLPEEFVGDVVIRLRAHYGARNYSGRTIEFEKVRGQPHVGGQHDLRVRHLGSWTGGVPNPDEPDVGISYIQVFPSLHRLSRRSMHSKDPATQVHGETDAYCGFGIEFLDRILGRRREMAPKPGHAEPPPPGQTGTDDFGLPAGTVTALIGNEATYKSRLGRAFLSRCFARRGTDSQDPTKSEGIAVLLTTEDLEQEKLARRLELHLGTTLTPAQRDRIVCRRLRPHHLTSAGLMDIVQRAVERAHQLRSASQISGGDAGHVDRWRIRLVIDDWSTIQSMYPDVSNDPLFLPFLVSYLQREAISALIVDTQHGSPSRILEQEIPHDLRNQTQQLLYTWHVSFFGERRVAIMALPGGSPDLPTVVRELKPAESGDPARSVLENEHLEVDPHFEIYQGLEDGKPTPVPLRVFLFAETEQGVHQSYFVQMEELLRQLSVSQNGKPVLTVRYGLDYERLRECSYLQSEARLDHTLVLQVDEFWADTQVRSGLRRQEGFLCAETVRSGGPVTAEDPFGLFRRTHATRAGVSKRYQFFDTIGHDYESYPAETEFEKVPYMWDFGLLLCQPEAWVQASGRTLKEGRTVEMVWNNLLKPAQGTEGALSWREFLEACIEVRRATGTRNSLAFDVDLLAIESFACLVLEMWASEVDEFQPPVSLTNSEKGHSVFQRRRSDGYGPSLEELLRSPDSPQCLNTNDQRRLRDALYSACLLLSEVFTTDQFTDTNMMLQPRAASSEAVAARHWYSSATVAMSQQTSARLVAVGLPGRRTVRGDWFLAVARGSRSPRLGERAMDLLCSRRGNIERLQSGMGLPVRDLFPSAAARQEFRTTLCQWEPEPKSLSPIMYDDLRQLGPWDDKDEKGRKDCSWLWRSTIRYYDLHTRIWQKWLRCVVRTWPNWATPRSGDGHSKRFSEYDRYVRGGRQDYDSERYQDFNMLCDGLVEALKRATYESKG